MIDFVKQICDASGDMKFNNGNCIVIFSFRLRCGNHVLAAAALIFLVLVCSSLGHAQTGDAIAWKQGLLVQLDQKIAGAVAGEIDELNARKSWLLKWQPGEMKARPTSKTEVPRKRIEPRLVSAVSVAMGNGIACQWHACPDDCVFQKLSGLASQYPNDVAAQQTLLHWMDDDPTRRKQFLDQVENTTVTLGQLLERSIQFHPSAECKLVLEFTRYRRARALAYRELPSVVANRPIENPERLDRQIKTAFDDLVGAAGSGRTEFILLEIRMLRRSGQPGLALSLLEKYGATILPKWYQKKRRDILNELDWTIPHREAAAIFAKNFPKEAASRP